MTDEGKKRGGFATLWKTDPERARALCAKGGKAAQASGRAHRYTSEEARVAGRKGGQAISRDRAHMQKIGAAGGRKSHSPKVSQVEGPGGPRDEGPFLEAPPDTIPAPSSATPLYPGWCEEESSDG